MLTEQELIRLPGNQMFLAREFAKRGIETGVFCRQNEILEARCGHRIELFLDLDCSIMPYTATTIASSKSVTRRLLERAEISVPMGQAFLVSNVDSMCEFARALYPVVVKPSVGSGGKLVFAELCNEDEIYYAAQTIHAALGNVEVLVEEHCHGNEFRVFVTRGGDFAVAERQAASVLGDGERTIVELIDSENQRRRELPPSSLEPIVVDEVVRARLGKLGFSLSSVPMRGVVIRLRHTTNVSLGGTSSEVSLRAHPSVIEICLKALSVIPGMPYAGVDFITKDVTLPQSSKSYRILELNALPGLALHMAPAAGPSRNVAAMIADLIFPESKALK